MAESFGNSCTIVEVMPDYASGSMWIALAKPNQAITLMLAEGPEGWFEEINLQPGDVYRLPSD